MSKYWQFMGEYDAVSDTWTDFAGGSGASPFKPVEDARMKGVRVCQNRDAATSLVDHVQVRMISPSFGPGIVDFGVQGSGLQTAPAFAAYNDWECDLPVKGGNEITLQGRNIGADTQVTVSVVVYGYFDNGKG